MYMSEAITLSIKVRTLGPSDNGRETEANFGTSPIRRLLSTYMILIKSLMSFSLVTWACAFLLWLRSILVTGTV